MINQGTQQTGQKTNSTNNSNNKNNNYSPKTGLFKASVAAINPSISQINELLGREMNWEVQYVGQKEEGESKANIDIWLQDIVSKNYYRLKFIIVDKLRDSKNNPGMFQWVNSVGDVTWANDVNQITTDKRFETFRTYSFHQAKVGEENLVHFLSTWILQGKKPWENLTIEPDIKSLFQGDFSELQQQVPLMQQRKDGGVIMALATISESNGKQYQNVWKRILPAWLGDKFLEGDRGGKAGKWHEEATGAYGIKDTYSLEPIGDNQTTTQSKPASDSGYNTYGKNPPNMDQKAADNYKQYSNTMPDGNTLPF